MRKCVHVLSKEVNGPVKNCTESLREQQWHREKTKRELQKRAREIFGITDSTPQLPLVDCFGHVTSSTLRTLIFKILNDPRSLKR